MPTESIGGDVISSLLKYDIIKDGFNKKSLERVNNFDFDNDSIRQYVKKQVVYFLEDLAEKLRKEESGG